VTTKVARHTTRVTKGVRVAAAPHGQREDLDDVICERRYPSTHVELASTLRAEAAQRAVLARADHRSDGLLKQGPFAEAP
jgi:hypothetical protein